MKWKKESDEVLYQKNLNQVIQISRNDIQHLKDIAQESARHQARICAHSGKEEDIHEMVIYHQKGAYLHPHKFHINTESYLLLEGEIDVVLFNDLGEPLKVIEMGTIGSQKTFFFRLPQPMFRTLILKQDSVFLEVKTGPFNPDNRELAKWAPHHEEISEVNKYLDQLSLSVKNLLTNDTNNLSSTR